MPIPTFKPLSKFSSDKVIFCADDFVGYLFGALRSEIEDCVVAIDLDGPSKFKVDCDNQMIVVTNCSKSLLRGLNKVSKKYEALNKKFWIRNWNVDPRHGYFPVC